MNSFSVEGRLGKDPEVVNYKNGKEVVMLRLATRKNFSNETMWLNCRIGVQQENAKEFAKKYLKKGSTIFIAGFIDIWQGDSGSKVTVEVLQVAFTTSIPYTKNNNQSDTSDDRFDVPPITSNDQIDKECVEIW